MKNPLVPIYHVPIKISINGSTPLPLVACSLHYL